MGRERRILFTYVNLLFTRSTLNAASLHLHKLVGITVIDSDEVRFRLFSLLQKHPYTSQREIGVSVGQIIYGLKTLIERGEVKICNFQTSNSKIRYAYVLTPKGVEASVKLFSRFLKRKLAEYDRLQQEVQILVAEVRPSPHPGEPFSQEGSR